jgi:(p)ppGpp synthase/HD superfamily hydrolase
MEKVLEQIKDFADQAHGDQVRKYSPERYIAHPMRVMEMCRSYVPRIPVLAAALLHDVLEDTEVNDHQLSEFLQSIMNQKEAAQTLRLVVELTDIFTKSAYPNLNRRRRKEKEIARLGKISDEAQTIKYADIIDNCRAIGSQDTDFAPVFLNECRLILNAMTKGNSDLREEAIKIVQEELESIDRIGGPGKM